MTKTEEFTSLTDLLTADDAPDPREQQELPDKPRFLLDIINDMSYSTNYRLQAFKKYYQLNSLDDSIGVINLYCQIYLTNKTYYAQDFLTQIVQDLEYHYRILYVCFNSLVTIQPTEELYDTIWTIYQYYQSTLTVLDQLDVLYTLFHSENLRDLVKDEFIRIINDPAVECRYRFNTVDKLSYIQRRSETDKEFEQRQQNFAYFHQEGLIAFALNDQNETKYRLVACQHGLVESDVPDKRFTNILIEFMENKHEETNTRADACDILLNYGDAETRTRAVETLKELSADGKLVHTIYDDAQNVHTVSITKSVEKTLEYLYTHVTKTPQTFEEILAEIRKLAQGSNDEKKANINLALERIEIDRAVYGKFRCTLRAALVKVWHLIAGHEHEDELHNRLLEELEEMAGVCSTGYIARLFNVLTVYFEVGINIDWADQIKANLHARLNKKMQDDWNVSTIEPMYNIYQDPTKRERYTEFLQTNVPLIKETLWLEFRDHISKDDFEFYFREAVIAYDNI